MTKKDAKLLAWMLVGLYVEVSFPIGVFPDWLNLGVQLAGMIAFWVSAYKLTND